MSGDIDFCRLTLKGPSLRLAKEILAPFGGKCIGRNWKVCGLFIDLLGIVESETTKDFRKQDTPYGVVDILPPELALVERVFYAVDSEECVASAKQMTIAALNDPCFDWKEAERLAALPSFRVLDELLHMKEELQS